MTISTGQRFKLGIIPETVFGTTPATPNLTEVPITNSTLNLEREEYADNSIRSDGMERYSISGNKSVGGTIDVQFSHSLFDSFLESLMFSTFTTNVLKKGTTRKSFTVEESQQDIAQYRVYTGLIVDKLDMTIPSTGIVTAKFSMVAKDQSALAGTSIDTDGYTAAASKNPFTDAGGTFKEGGLAVANMTNIQLTIDNGNSRNYALGSQVIRDFTQTMQHITGTATFFFEDSTAYNKFVNGTPSSIDFTLSDGTNTVEINLPNVKYTGGTKTINNAGPVEIAMPFKALYDSTSASTVVITRS